MMLSKFCNFSIKTQVVVSHLLIKYLQLMFLWRTHKSYPSTITHLSWATDGVRVLDTFV